VAAFKRAGVMILADTPDNYNHSIAQQQNNSLCNGVKIDPVKKHNTSRVWRLCLTEQHWYEHNGTSFPRFQDGSPV